MAVREAVAMACRVRLRPVLMTSLATIIGLLPMALKLGAGSEAYAPLARAILGGLSVSVALTVFLVPAAYVLVYGGRADAAQRESRLVHALSYLVHSAIAMAGVRWCLCRAQPPMHLTLAEAQRLAIQNNPQFTAAKFTAAAAVPGAATVSRGL